jgi:hypothetical protein
MDARLDRQTGERGEHFRDRVGTIRSLAYFLPVIEEVLTLPVNPNYFRYLRQKWNASLQRGRQTAFLAVRQITIPAPCAPLARMIRKHPRTPRRG